MWWLKCVGKIFTDTHSVFTTRYGHTWFNSMCLPTSFSVNNDCHFRPEYQIWDYNFFSVWFPKAHNVRTDGMITWYVIIICFRVLYHRILYSLLDILEIMMARNIKFTSLGYMLVVVIVILHSGCAVTVDMSLQNLRTVPQTIEPSVTKLILKYNDLDTLDGGSFNKFVELLELNVDFCGIYIIYSGAFAAQVKLVTLSMRYNSIRELPLDFGPPINSLVTVDVYSTFVVNYDLNPLYFSAFKQVKVLELGGKALIFNKTHIPYNMTKLSLKSMLKAFPDLSNLAQLETLSVCHHEVTFIPDGYIQGLDSLSTLYLCDGNLNVLPRLSLLKNLVKLIAGGNPLTEIPRNKIEGLDKLKTVSFSSCQIQVMPNISYLPSLQMVYLQKNRIHYILNGTLRGLPSLYLLDLSENMISQTDGLQHITLGRMFLNDNQLTILPDLFDMKISILEIGNNPLVCNQ